MKRPIPINPLDYRLLICCAYHEGHLTLHQALHRLWNAGMRGPFLNVMWNHENAG